MVTQPGAPDWRDEGPKSQGKILTAILQGRQREAEQMLRGWNKRDLAELANAAEDLLILCHLVGRRGRPNFGVDRGGA